MEDLNYIVLSASTPALILVGVLGFLIPANKSFVSRAPAYNIFHIIFGLIGAALLFVGTESGIRGFNIGFGLIDLYQAVASFAHLFPEKHFRWTRVDDVLHIVIGTALVLVGLFG